MTKKRRQSDPQLNNSESSSDDNDKANNIKTESDCSHIKKSVDIQRLRKIFKSAAEINKCSMCAKLDPGSSKADDYEYDRTLWMCLKCGTHLCGRLVSQHALDHYKTPRSDSHAIALNTTTYELWCYECDEFIKTHDSKLAQCIEFIKKEKARATNATPTKSKETVPNGNVKLENNESANISVDSMRSLLSNTISIVHSLGGNAPIPGQAKRVVHTIEQLPRVRGLSNLGNTCFFNAVMQCLAQTPFLLQVLKELSSAGEQFELPGGKLKLKESEEEVQLQPISGVLQAWGPLTASLADALGELKKGGDVHNPRKIFSNLTDKWPQFDGGDQHDSHELLRHLLESVKTEDLNRYWRAILKALPYKDYRGIDIQSVPSEMKQTCKFYGQQASERILCPEKVFRGFLVSTLTCQECFHTSSRHENFLDLSLPVCVDKPAPPVRRKSPDESSQLKENSKQKAKMNRARKASHRSSSASESDADVEDNDCEDCVKKITETAIDTNGNVSNDKTEKVDDGPEFNDKDSLAINAEANELIALGISSKGGQELAKQISVEEDLCVGQQKLNPSPTHLMHSFEQLNVSDSKRSLKNKAQRKRLISYTDWGTTMAPRYQCEDGECSIQSCLNNFTAVELMTANNKVGCDSCSERVNGKGGKTINTTATKQFLISSPPAVLILHLKRFQVGPRFMFRKLSKHVSFPFTLDLAPFCASKVKTLPNVHRHQKQLLYSLYGIVEHSGSMHGGHYVAYVKVRPGLPSDDQRWKFLPKGSKVELDQTDEQKERLDNALKRFESIENRLRSADSDDLTSSSDSDATTTKNMYAGSGSREPPAIPAPPEGKWYYVSDSHVSEASEERVLGAQAYLLFYERIY